MIIFILSQMCRGDDDQQINYRQFNSSTWPLFNGLNPCWTLLKNLIHMILGDHWKFCLDLRCCLNLFVFTKKIKLHNLVIGSLVLFFHFKLLAKLEYWIENLKIAPSILIFLEFQPILPFEIRQLTSKKICIELEKAYCFQYWKDSFGLRNTIMLLC